MKESCNFLRTLALVLALAGLAQGTVQSQSPSATGESKAQVPAGASTQAQRPNPQTHHRLQWHRKAKQHRRRIRPTNLLQVKRQHRASRPKALRNSPLPAQTSVPLRVMVGKSLLVNTSDRLKRCLGDRPRHR